MEGEAALTAARQEALAALRARVIAIRKELRAVQRALRQEVDRLQLWLQFANTLAVPLLLAVAAGTFSWIRRRRAAAVGG